MSHRPEPVCGNLECPCWVNDWKCPEFIGHIGPYCIRCGWEEVDHQPRRPLFHNGRKPR